MCVVSEEFSAKRFLLNPANPRCFAEPTCGGSTIGTPIYLIYRLAWPAFFIGVTAYDLSIYQFGAIWLVFLSHWHDLFLILEGIILAVITAINYTKTDYARSKDFELYKSTPFLWRLEWVLRNINFSVAIGVTVLFFVTEFMAGQPLAVFTIGYHLVNSAYVLFDFFVANVPVVLSHAFHTMVFAGVYSSFLGIYWAAGGLGESGTPIIYNLIDFDGAPGLTAGILVAIVFVAAPVLHLLYWGLYKLKSCFTKCGHEGKVSENQVV